MKKLALIITAIAACISLRNAAAGALDTSHEGLDGSSYGLGGRGGEIGHFKSNKPTQAHDTLDRVRLVTVEGTGYTADEAFYDAHRVLSEKHLDPSRIKRTFHYKIEKEGWTQFVCRLYVWDTSIPGKTNR